MITGHSAKKDLITKLTISHQRFLNSRLARDISNNSTPQLSLYEIQKEMIKSDIPVSAIVIEGRKQ